MIVPKTTISGYLNGKPFSVVSPKDSTLTGLDIVAHTNGEISVHIESLSAKMNPEVITMSAQAQVDIISALGTQIGNIAGKTAQSAAKP